MEEETILKNEVEPVPYIVHEGEVARLERIIKRLWIVLILVIVFLVATNGVWIWYESQFEEIVMTQEATTDGGGDAVVNGVASGDLYYGTGEANGQGQTP